MGQRDNIYFSVSYTTRKPRVGEQDGVNYNFVDRAEFERMITSRGKEEGDEDLIGDGVAFAGVSKYPARVKCALLGWKAFQAATADALADGSADAAPAGTDTTGTDTTGDKEVNR